MNFKIWKTVFLGVHKSARIYQNALVNADFRIGNRTNDLLNKIPISQFKIRVDLAIASVFELGFDKPMRFREIFCRIKELGGQLCFAEVGPACREAYPEQPNQEDLWIAMEPISDSDGDLRIFKIIHGGSGRYLESNRIDLDFVCLGDSRFVFMLPRKSQK